MDEPLKMVKTLEKVKPKVKHKMLSKLEQKIASRHRMAKPQNKLHKPKNKPKNKQGKTDEPREQENRKEKLVKTTEIVVLKKSRIIGDQAADVECHTESARSTEKRG
eukprot:14534684-Ditylum_brightwellii.AAC.1